MIPNSVWITGAYGFIGRHLASAIALSGLSVSGIGHGHWRDEFASLWGVSNWINGDINYGNLQLLKKKVGTPHTIYHLAGGSSVGAAIVDPQGNFDRTVGGTVELLEWMRLEAPTTKLVAISSAAVYGSMMIGCISEDSKLLPYSSYGYHKLMMEALCRSYADTYGLSSVVARIFSVYGAGLRKQLLWDLCSKLQTNSSSVELGGTGHELRDWIDVRDVVRALILISKYANSTVPTFNIGTGIATEVREISRYVMLEWSKSSSVGQLIFNQKSRVGDPYSMHADIQKLTNLGFEFRVPLAKGLIDYVHWFRHNCSIE